MGSARYVSGVSKLCSVSHERRRPLDHLGGTFFRECQDVAVEPTARVRVDTVPQRPQRVLVGDLGRGPMRPQQRPFALRRAAGRIELGVDGAHLVLGQERAARPTLADVESIRKTRRHAHDTGAGAADPQRRIRSLHGLRSGDRVLDAVVLARIRRALLGPEASADLDRVDHLVDPRARVEVVIPVRLVFVDLPSRADPELDPSARHVIDPRDDLREQGGVAVLRRSHETAEPDGRRVARERREHGPRLEAVAVGYALPAEEVIAYPERLEADALGRACEIPELEIGPAGRGGDDSGELHAGSRPQTMRETPRIARPAAVDHAIAETSGASKSVPESAAWKKSATNAR